MPDDEDLLIVDCEDEGFFPANPGLNDELKEYLEKNTFEQVLLKTPTFKKLYDEDLNLLNVTPFFIDVTLGNEATNMRIEDIYELSTGAKVKIFKAQQGTHYIYHLEIPEEDVSFSELSNIKRATDKFKRTGEVEHKYVKRWYKGHGILEHLMQDENVLEINVNPPAFSTSLRIVHAEYQECTSNIYANKEFLNFMLTRLKTKTGRPLNKSQPQIDGELYVEGTKARVAGIISPFSVFGVGFSIRKHREEPWTLPLFIDNDTINSLYAGFMSLVISHGRTFLTAGPRGSGKTSMLGSLILEILQRYRILTIEDTQELPIESYKELGYDILPLKVRSALIEESLEMPFDKGLRTSLRLGDSALIVGEVRSKEAKVLYEAMRVGAMSNVVAGTIHADSPYGVYDRVVNDLGVPKGSFKATDLVVIQNQIKDPSGIGRKRRVVQVTEVKKRWEDKPQFQDMFKYNPESDELEPTDYLLEGKSVIFNHILERAEGYHGYEDLLEDMYLRAWAKETMVKLSDGNIEKLEAKNVSKQNNLFMKLVKDIEPFESEENMEQFKQAYQQKLKRILASG